jgi:uncharacterized protein YjlB
MLSSYEAINKNAKIIREILKDDGTYPNNADLPALIYQGVLETSNDMVATIEGIFRKNQWEGSWRNGIYAYQQYHSTAHDVLGVNRGQEKVQQGGPKGDTINLQAGDFIIIPAGVAHKNLGSSSDFACVGAYPPGQSYDMYYGKEEERARAKANDNMQNVPIPPTDPVYGEDGPLTEYWKK